MSTVLRPRSHSLPSGFAQLIARKFGRGPFLVAGAERDELERQFRAAETDAAVFGSVNELPPALSQNGVASRADLAIWFYPRNGAGDERAVQVLAAAAED